MFHRLYDWFVRVLNGEVCHLCPCSQLLAVFRAVYFIRALLHVTRISTPGVSNVPTVHSSAVFCRRSTMTIQFAA